MLKLGESVAVSKKVCPALQEFPRAPGSVGGGALLRYIRGGGERVGSPSGQGARIYVPDTVPLPCPRPGSRPWPRRPLNRPRGLEGAGILVGAAGFGCFPVS